MKLKCAKFFTCRCCQLTRGGWDVRSAVTGWPVLEVVVAVVRPQTAVVEAKNVVYPMGLSGHTGRLPERRRTPVMSSVWGAAADGVTRQYLSTSVVVATLLACT